MPNDPRDSTNIRRRIIYHGRVQGVGFRYTVATIARQFPVVGYVKNLRDGTVELVVETGSPSLQEFLTQVDAALQGHITNRVADEAVGSEEFTKFEIRF